MRSSNIIAKKMLVAQLRSLSHELLQRLMLICYLTVALVVPAQAYNPDHGHPWITVKAIEYLRLSDPIAYLLADQYNEQLRHGVWYADRNSGLCTVDFLFFDGKTFQCDSANHFEPQFHYQAIGAGNLGAGVNGSISASNYAGDLFRVASECWPLRDVDVDDLPASCKIPQWRGVGFIGLGHGFGVFRNNGPPFGASPMVLLGWVLHFVQDVTVPYHTYSEPGNGHQGFEDYVDRFINTPNAASLPVDTADRWLNVLNVKDGEANRFVQQVATETQALAKSRGWWKPANNGIPIPAPAYCCNIGSDIDKAAELSVNRAIVYSAKLLSFYLRQPAIDLSSALWTSVF